MRRYALGRSPMAMIQAWVCMPGAPPAWFAEQHEEPVGNISAALSHRNAADWQ